MNQCHHNPASTMADQFIDRLDQTLGVVEQWPKQSAIPRTAETALAAEVDLACDVLTDADIRRQDMNTSSGFTEAELLNITMPDCSEVTALCNWAQDHIYLVPGRFDTRSWPQMRNARTILNPWSPPGCRAFDNLQEGHNATEYETDIEPDQQPDAISLEAALAGTQPPR